MNEKFNGETREERMNYNQFRVNREASRVEVKIWRRPISTGYWWACGKAGEERESGYRAKMRGAPCTPGYHLFVVDVGMKSGTFLVRFADEILPTKSGSFWFKPDYIKWTHWIAVEEPKIKT